MASVIDAFAATFAPQLNGEAKEVLHLYLQQAADGEEIEDMWHTVSHTGYGNPCDQAYWIARLYAAHKAAGLPVPCRFDPKLYQLSRLAQRGIEGADDAIKYLGVEYEPEIRVSDDEMASALVFASVYAREKAKKESFASDSIRQGFGSPACVACGAMLACGDKAMIKRASDFGVHSEACEIALTYRTIFGRGAIIK